MNRGKWFTPSRLEIVNAILIAIVSLTTAIVVWRMSVVASSAADAARTGLIEAVKKQAFGNEDFRKTYEEAGFAYQFAVKQAEVQALEASGDASAKARAVNISQYLLPNLQLLAEPLATDERYQKADGTYDLEKRLADIPEEDEQQLNPLLSFEQADSFHAEQRWLVVGSILLAISLFWLALAEVTGGRWRVLELLIGLGIYLFGLLWVFGVELLFILGRGA